ncbi:hypothetical protein [Vibrio hepatarius]|uniref:hypothetical protein n=1 Tax=Vibrio hepatarius TaxID=171383 RepID=UPI00148C79CB|nr:hypothetical protein [Vibrio hepatarius]NOI14815.1 hypothetical protein [Vibrio hepatarius]
MVKLTRPGRFIEIDATGMCKPLYEELGFDTEAEYEDFLYSILKEKEAYIFSEFKSRCGGVKISDITQEEVKKIALSICNDWHLSQKEKYKGTKMALLFDDGGLLSHNPDVYKELHKFAEQNKFKL